MNEREVHTKQLDMELLTEYVVTQAVSVGVVEEDEG